MPPGEDAIYQMVLRDFEQFPAMWHSYVQRHSTLAGPLQKMADALARRDIDEALQTMAAFPREFVRTPKGQVARAMIDFAQRGS